MSAEQRAMTTAAALVPPALDGEAATFTAQTVAPRPGVGPVKGTVGGYFGKAGLVQVWCYARQPEFDRDAAALGALTTSLRWDGGRAFPARPRSGVRYFVIGGVAAVAVGAGLLVFAVRAKRRRPAGQGAV